MVICQCLANYSCLLLNRHCLFFFLSFVPDTSTGSFCSLPASEISNRKQNATLRSEARGGHLWAGNVYDCCPSTFCGRLFLNYTCARANCGWWSGTNSKINEPHSEFYSLWNGLTYHNVSAEQKCHLCLCKERGRAIVKNWNPGSTLRILAVIPSSPCSFGSPLF